MSSKTQTTVKRGKRPFPKDTIEESRKIAETIKKYNAGKPWDPKEVAKALDLKLGNKFFYLTSSSVGYGLTNGTRVAKIIEVTSLGRKLVYPDAKEDELEAILQAFLNVEIFKKVYNHYDGGKLPEIKYLSNTLKTTFDLDEHYHQDFHDLYQDNLNYLQKNGFNTSQKSNSPKSSNDYSTVVVGTNQNSNELTAFVAMPFSEKSGKYNEGYFDEVLKQLIVPAAVEAGYVFHVPTPRAASL